MTENETAQPDSTAVRVALWRAMHAQIDSPPLVLDDEIGLKLVAPTEDWRKRPDMNPAWTRRIRASIVARTRFVEDLLAEQAERGVGQYVLLGAGLDTFAERNTKLASRLRVFEIDRPGPQAWKRERLNQLGYGVPAWLRMVSVDFEKMSWWDALLKAGFDEKKPAVIASTGVSMYLTDEANRATLRRLATLAPGSTVVVTFMLPIELVDEEDRDMAERAKRGASMSGTPFISFYAPADLVALAKHAGLKNPEHVSAEVTRKRYFANRKDGLLPSNGEEILVART